MKKEKLGINALFFLLFLVGTLTGYTQTPNPLVDNQLKKYPLEMVKKVATVNLAEAPDDPFATKMYNTSKVKVHNQGDPDKEAYKAGKARANAEKAEFEKNYIPGTSFNSNKIMGDPPIQGVNKFANTQDGIPQDHAVAVSKDGFVVCATNSRVQVYDEDGNAKLTKTLAAFYSIAGTKFDP